MQQLLSVSSGTAVLWQYDM